MRERRNQKFMLALSSTERGILHRLADRERSPSAAVVRRLIWREAERRGLLPAKESQAQGHAAREVSV